MSFLLIFGEEGDSEDLFTLNSFNNHFDWIKYSHGSWGSGIKIFSDFMFKDFKMYIILIASTSDSCSIAKVIESFSRISSSSESINSEYSGIVPAINLIGKHQLMKFSFGHDRMRNIETRVFPDIWLKKVQFLEEPIVELSSDFELKRAKRVRNALKTIAYRMGIVVHRVNTPFVSHLRMFVKFNAVNHWISQGCIRMFMVNFSPQ